MCEKASERMSGAWKNCQIDIGCVKHVAKMTSDVWQSRQNDVGCVKKLLKSHQMREQVTKIMSDMRKISLKCHRIREKDTQLVSRETTANLGREHPWGMSPMRPHKTPQYFGNETNVLFSREHPWATNAKRRERRHNKRSIHGPWPRGGVDLAMEFDRIVVLRKQCEELRQENQPKRLCHLQHPARGGLSSNVCLL